MKRILLCLILISLSGCSIGWIGAIPDGYYGRSTTIGIDAGFPEGISLVIGYRKHEGIICKNDTDIKIDSDTEAELNGLNVKESLAFGKGVAHSSDITVNE